MGCKNGLDSVLWLISCITGPGTKLVWLAEKPIFDTVNCCYSLSLDIVDSVFDVLDIGIMANIILLVSNAFD
jgi:hypothetical protein